MNHKISSHLLSRITFAWMLLAVLIPASISAQTTGKLTGKVTDNAGEPMIGASVIVEGTKQGAAVDASGYYVVLNLRAGLYTVTFQYIGYQQYRVEKVKISSDQTTALNAVLSPISVQTKAVTITASKPLVEFNQTSSVSSVTKEEIENLPLQDLNQIVNLQAGVVDGHFRGGRLGEVQYQVDGVTVNNPFNNSSTLQLDKSVIQEVQVISGTFDAKYGQAMSGVVNAVLRTGSDKFDFSGEIFLGQFFTTDTKRFPGNDQFTPGAIHNYQLTLSGPTYLPQTTFLISARRYFYSGYLFGQRRFMPTDKSDVTNLNFNPTGNNAKVAMNTSKEWSGQFKITNNSFQKIQFSYQAIYNIIESKYYSHAMRLNPSGTAPNNTLSLSHGIDFVHTLSSDMFYRISVRQNLFDYHSYKYGDLFDPRYIEAGITKSSGSYEAGAVVQGVDLNRYKQKTNSFIGKADFTWQYDKSNLIEAGLEAQISEMSFGTPDGFIANTTVDGVEVLLPQYASKVNDPKKQTYHPSQMAAYIQDRVELGDLVVRAGLRAEYYDANSELPGDLQNPTNSIKNVPTAPMKNTTVKLAFAPRLGFSFPLTDRASIYFAYGHFYQMPELGQLFSNSDYHLLDNLQADQTNYGTMGNPDLKPQLTVQYEVGLKQAINENLGTELTFFYKDLRDLLGTEFVTTYNSAKYMRLTNVDFGSVYGFTISFDQRQIGPISATLDYTMQFCRGNSSDPYETANRAAGGKDPRPRDIPFSWDQHHTLNISSIWLVPDDYSISAILRIGSGMPYTPATGAGFNADLETNSGRKDSYALLDIQADKIFQYDGFVLKPFIRVSNVLNTYNVNGFVFPATGSPDYSTDAIKDRSQLLDPSRFHEPRKIEIGVSFRSR